MSTQVRMKNNLSLFGLKILLLLLLFGVDTQGSGVCYFIDTIKDDDNNTVFKDKIFITKLENSKNYKFNIWISNMKSNSDDTPPEIANLVIIYMKTTNVNYTASSTDMKNINEALKQITDRPNDDEGEYDNNKSTWRVGVDANSTDGGTVALADNFRDDLKKIFISFESQLYIENSATSIDLLDFFEFRVSLKTDSITISPDDTQNLNQCRDISTYRAVSQPPLGTFNITNRHADMSTGDPTDGNALKNALFTQISDKPFDIKIVSLDSDMVGLKNFKGNIILDLIDGTSVTSEQDSCTNAPLLQQYTNPNAHTDMFENNSTVNFSLRYPKAIKDARFRVRFYDFSLFIDDDCDPNSPSTIINGVPRCLDERSKMTDYFPDCAIDKTDVCDLSNQAGDDNWACYECIASYNTPVCSRDNFAIRPKKFMLVPPLGEDMELLTSAKEYNLSLIAKDNRGNPTTDYDITVANNVLDTNQTLYLQDDTIDDSLDGYTSWASNDFNITNGSALDVVGIQFTDVGKVNIQVRDTSWSKVDIDDTPQNCDDNGSYICGDINATFIPYEFNITEAHLYNDQNNSFTYLSDDLNMSVHVGLIISALNYEGNVTKNFSAGEWENPVDVNLTVPTRADLVKNDINSSIKLGFTDGNMTISWDETDSSKNLIFNFDRDKNTAQNPFSLNGLDVNLTAKSTYTSSTSDTKDVSGSGELSDNQNVTFYYGRVHVPDCRFDSVDGDATVFYEVYSDQNQTVRNSFDINGSESVDSISWYINTLHNTLSAGNVSRYTALGGVDLEPANSINISNGTETVKVTTENLPYKDKINMTSSSWLMSNPTDFMVEFYSAGSWEGQGTKGKTIDLKISKKQNKRLDW